MPVRPAPRLGVPLLAALVLAAPVALAQSASASATANELVYVASSEDGVQLLLRDLGSRRTTVVLPNDDDRNFVAPELSPDGSQIALTVAVFDETADDVAFRTAVVRRDGTGFRFVTPPVASTPAETVADFGPRWSPDGSTLLFTRLRLEEATERVRGSLLTVSPAGGEPVPVRGAEQALDGDWSPDGRSLVIAAGPVAPTDEDAPLAVLELATGATRPLEVRGYAPSWSPDGSLISFSRVLDPRTANTAIGVVPAAGGPATTLAATINPDGGSDTASWAPDSQSLVFTSFEEGTDTAEGSVDLFAVDRAGTRAGRLVAGSTGIAEAGFLQGPAPTQVRGSAPAGFTGVRPQRLLDTRAGVGAPTGKVGPGGTLDLAVSGQTTSAGPVPATATAVVLNVTVTAPTASTDVRAYPAGAAVPTVSNLNAPAGSTVPNLVTVPLGADGRVTLRNSSGTVHLVADLAGWYAPGAGDGFAPVGPVRLLDTRSSGGRQVGQGGTLDLQVTGTPAPGVVVPPDATAVVLNLTATRGSAPTDVRAYPTPTDGAVPTVSNLNVARGQTAAGLVTVAVGDGGRVRLRNERGSVDLLADLAGYYSASAPGRFVAAAPVRLLDTRDATGTAPIPVTAGGLVDLAFAGARGIPATATAGLLNLTATGVSATTDVRAYPAGRSDVPTVSNLNVVRGQTRANLAVVVPGEGGRVRFRNSSGSTQLVGDLAGWFVPAS